MIPWWMEGMGNSLSVPVKRFTKQYTPHNGGKRWKGGKM
jgi:hypothetical protein